MLQGVLIESKAGGVSKSPREFTTAPQTPRVVGLPAQVVPLQLVPCMHLIWAATAARFETDKFPYANARDFLSPCRSLQSWNPAAIRALQVSWNARIRFGLGLEQLRFRRLVWVWLVPSFHHLIIDRGRGFLPPVVEQTSALDNRVGRQAPQKKAPGAGASAGRETRRPIEPWIVLQHKDATSRLALLPKDWGHPRQGRLFIGPQIMSCSGITAAIST